MRDFLSHLLSHFKFSVFGFFFALFGVGMAVWGGFIVKDANESVSWPTVQGEMIGSRVDREVTRDSDGSASTSYRANVTYRYVVEEVEYTGKKVFFGKKDTAFRWSAQKIVKRYPWGKKVRVYYDPEQPEAAVLEPGARLSSYWKLGIGLLCVLLGVACNFSTYWPKGVPMPPPTA